MTRSPVIFVSAGMVRPKKREHALARRQLYLNYGALTLATACARGGVAAQLMHGEHRDPALFAEGLRPSLLKTPSPLMLSLPSFYALSWAQVFCRTVKQIRSDLRIVVGGRWVTGPDPDWLKRKLPEADTIVTGLGENAVSTLLGLNGYHTDETAVPRFGLQHKLVDQFERYQPSIEASRGCGKGLRILRGESN